MQLNEVKKGTKLKLIKRMHYLGKKPEAMNILDGELLVFEANDGLYSICTDREGNQYNIPGWSKIEIIEEPLADSE
jgi:hypothetical protein|tara:strand:+ start:11002 stop:11229 length:228 start_codon:yes stop_codon:yes gene_type:complete